MLPKTPVSKSRKSKATAFPTTGWATLDQAAEFFGVSRRTVERLIAAGKLTRTKISHNVSRLDWADLWQYLGTDSR